MLPAEPVQADQQVGPADVVVRRVVVGVLDTNCWLVHARGRPQALPVDPGAEPSRLLAAVRDHALDVTAIVLTHAHFDHVLAVPELVEALGVPVLAHPDDALVWPHELAGLASTGSWDAGTATGRLLDQDPALLRPDPGRRLWNGQVQHVRGGQVLHVGPLPVRVLHTPGHTPGGLSLHVPGHVLTGDTLFPGGPGLTGPALSDFGVVMRSVRRLLALPGETVVHPGHGADTTVGAERPHVRSWQARGW